MSETWSTRIAETPDSHGAFPRLDEEQIDALSPYGEHRSTQAGDVLYQAGDPDSDFFVILSGSVALVEGHGENERVVAVHGPGRFVGGTGLLIGHATFLTAVVREAGEVLDVPTPNLRELVARDPLLGDVILRACIQRRSLLIGMGTGFRILGSRFSPETRRLLEFAARNRLPHRWIDLDDDEEAEALLRGLHVEPEETPVVIWKESQVLRNPSNAELARMLGLPALDSPDVVSDLLVVGAGPAGLGAAVYGASDGLSTVVVEGVAVGGQAGTSPRIENYLGFPSGISGEELTDRAVIQAEKFGARISVTAKAVALEQSDGNHVVRLEDGTSVTSRTVVIATGARYRKLDLARLEDFEGFSVYYAATEVEARTCANDPVVVVGGGNSAAQAALFLGQHAARVQVVVRHGELTKDMSRYLADRIERTQSIEVLLNTEVRELLGDQRLEGVVVENNANGEKRELKARAMFVFIGAEPHVRWLEGQLELDDKGFLLTGPDVARHTDAYSWQELGRQPLHLESSRPGIFVAGDVRSGSIKRVASAVGEGAMAVRLVHEHLGGVSRADP